MVDAKDRYIIAVDMDGTLINSEGIITERTTHVLQTLLNMGHLVVPASGRPRPLLPKEVIGLEGISYAVLENGAVLWNWKEDRPIAQKCLPAGIAQEILQDVVEVMKDNPSPYYPEFFVDSEAYAAKEDLELIEQSKIPGTFIEYMKNDHVFLENMVSHTELLSRVEKLNVYFEDPVAGEKFRERWKSNLDIYTTTSVAGNAEFSALGVDKGAALAELMERLHIPAEHVIAIGDNDNDVEMFEVAGHAVAMGNALEHVKAAANHVTEDNDHDGVAVFLEKFLL